jgi:hypothetical protein
MASAQYETITRTVEETSVLLRLTEDEANELRMVVGKTISTPTLTSVYRALATPNASEPADEATDTFEYAGVTYELGALYEDVENDRFEFGGGLASNGSPRGRLVGRGGDRGNWNWSLAEVAHNYGPLTKVAE